MNDADSTVQWDKTTITSCFLSPAFEAMLCGIIICAALKKERHWNSMHWCSLILKLFRATTQCPSHHWHNVLLTWTMHHVMYPARGLLDSEVSPLCLRHKMSSGNQFTDVRGQDNMSADVRRRYVSIKLFHAYFEKIILNVCFIAMIIDKFV